MGYMRRPLWLFMLSMTKFEWHDCAAGKTVIGILWYIKISEKTNNEIPLWHPRFHIWQGIRICSQRLIFRKMWEVSCVEVTRYIVFKNRTSATGKNYTTKYFKLRILKYNVPMQNMFDLYHYLPPTRKKGEEFE